MLTWTNGAITKQWLEVVVLANANTNLSPLAGYPTGQADVFFFGNALGDSGSGDTSTQANVNATDELAGATIRSRYSIIFRSPTCSTTTETPR